MKVQKSTETNQNQNLEIRKRNEKEDMGKDKEAEVEISGKNDEDMGKTKEESENKEEKSEEITPEDLLFMVCTFCTFQLFFSIFVLYFPSFFVYFLQVSANTGRIHLYRRVLENLSKDSKSTDPKFVPLEANFRPEDLKNSGAFSATHRLPPVIASSAPLLERSRAFLEEWNSLRAIMRKKLLNRPVGLPLHNYLGENLPVSLFPLLS